MNNKILFCWLGMTDIKSSTGEINGTGPIDQAVETFEFAEIHILTDVEITEANSYSDWLQGFTAAEITVHPHKLSSPINFSGMKKAHSPVQQQRKKVISNLLTVGHCFSMRSVNCRSTPRLNYCALFKNSQLSESEPLSRSK